MFFIIAIIIAAILLVILFAAKIKASAQYHHKHIKVSVKWLGIPIFNREFVFRSVKNKLFSLYAIQKKGEKLVLSLDDLMRLLFPPKKIKLNVKKSISYVFKKATYDIKVNFVIGTGDACFTALVCGMLQGIIGTFYATRNKDRLKLKATIIPQFAKQKLNFKADCIIKVSPVNIIIGYLFYRKK